MFGKNAAKKAQEDAARQQALANQQIATAQAPKPVETFLDRQNLDWLKMWDGVQEEGEGVPDITKAPGFGLQLAALNADSAADNQADERQGRGLMQMGLQGATGAANSGLATLLFQQSKDRRTQERGLNIQRAAAAKDAEVRGSLMPLLGLQTNRNMGLASLLSGNARAAQDEAFRRQQTSGFFNSGLYRALQQGGQTAAAAFGGGGG